jgi:hypothetical protein
VDHAPLLPTNLFDQLSRWLLERRLALVLALVLGEAATTATQLTRGLVLRLQFESESEYIYTGLYAVYMQSMDRTICSLYAVYIQDYMQSICSLYAVYMQSIYRTIYRTICRTICRTIYRSVQE